ncbi:MAG: molecular chaperone TorD family protein [Elusimicrobia bacterium]|nr:molecular chaperone TorD family protein [Elusimicrobiota bacterium]
MIRENKEKVKLKEIKVRGVIYRLFAESFREPNPIFVMHRELEMLLAELSNIGEIPLPPIPASDPSTEIHSVFGHNLSPDVPPYETHYGRLDVFRSTQKLANLSGFYRAFGLEPQAGDRRPDHLPIELEFISFLCLKEALALEREELENSEISRNARSKFLSEHLCQWIPFFTESLCQKASGSYYAGLSKSLLAFILWDAKSLGIELNVNESETVRKEDPEDYCSSCLGGI